MEYHSMTESCPSNGVVKKEINDGSETERMLC